jgi:hypothetical protein
MPKGMRGQDKPSRRAQRRREQKRRRETKSTADDDYGFLSKKKSATAFKRIGEMASTESRKSPLPLLTVLDINGRKSAPPGP